MPRILEARLSGAHPRSEALVEGTLALERRRPSPERCEATRLADAEPAVEGQRAARWCTDRGSRQVPSSEPWMVWGDRPSADLRAPALGRDLA